MLIKAQRLRDVNECISSFLHNRKARVTVDGKLSRKLLHHR